MPALAPQFIRGLTRQVAVTAGGSHTCGLGADGRVGCVGDNLSGQLGDGNGGDTDAVTTAVFARGVRASSVSAGYAHTCAQAASGVVRCWGDDTAGQLGDGTPDVLASSKPLPVHALTGIRRVAANGSTTCALTGQATVKCWGGYSYRPAAHPIPATIPGLSDVTVVAPNALRSCALLGDGTVSCWPDYGSRPPVRVPGITDATALSGDGRHCVLVAGSVWCWDAGHPAPKLVPGITGATDVFAGGLLACALLGGGQVTCWSGDAAPTVVPGLSQITKVSPGDMHSCAVRADGAALCWGSNTYGQLGNGTFGDSATPVRVRGISAAIAIGVGEEYSCALLAAGTVLCWGSDQSGALGDGRVDSDFWGRATPAPVVNLTHATSLAVGFGHACASVSNGTVRCWGNNESGELGQDPGWVPRLVRGL